MSDAQGRSQPIPLLIIGFRPFHLLAAAFAAVGLPVWYFAPGDVWPAGGYLASGAWHAHEMVLGFAAAVLAGFLLTEACRFLGGL